ncbi:LysR family transcriptional regulator [Falsiroseomonas sp.]|uniref:LysR family transcriptional regulator n=1 Tax=Falsiroseomonas sp. TaxID=2870721 RepID=UPI00271C4173|nr:LysR family transcriptional regulator [Falsiroseomonas sp.]MDO9503516.1 LysR substrate-binding domain-containing protein [Falsiroseomonas sp.]
MKLRGIDLNLLVILDALLEEAHVSRAADRLGLSQPATSSALERCRQLFGDRLLERAAGGMRRTPRAEALRPRLKDALAGLGGVLDLPEVPLAALRQTVRLLMADSLAARLLGPLVAALSRSAPGLDVVVQPWQGAPAALEGLARGTLDLAVSVIPPSGPDLRREELLREEYVVAMRSGHPALEGFDLERWLAFPHVLVSARGEMRGALDEALARQGRVRRVGCVVPHFLLVPPLLLGSDLIALLPGGSILGAMREGLAVLQPPVAVEGFPIHLALHRRREGDPAVRHVAATLQAVARATACELHPVSLNTAVAEERPA